MARIGAEQFREPAGADHLLLPGIQTHQPSSATPLVQPLRRRGERAERLRIKKIDCAQIDNQIGGRVLAGSGERRPEWGNRSQVKIASHDEHYARRFPTQVQP
jgi:hypothetical protein